MPDDPLHGYRVNLNFRSSKKGKKKGSRKARGDFAKTLYQIGLVSQHKPVSELRDILFRVLNLMEKQIQMGVLSEHELREYLQYDSNADSEWTTLWKIMEKHRELCARHKIDRPSPIPRPHTLSYRRNRSSMDNSASMSAAHHQPTAAVSTTSPRP